MATKKTSLADELNQRELTPGTVIEGKVYGFFDSDDNDLEFEESKTGVTHGYLDEHPEGADRGGYCPWVFRDEESAFWHEEWQKGSL